MAANQKLAIFNMCLLVFLFSGCTKYFDGSMRMIEKNFGLTAAKMGSLDTMDNVSGILLYPLIGYLGDKFNKLKIVGISCIITGVSYIGLSAPHWIVTYIYGKYGVIDNFNMNNKTKIDLLCFHNNSMSDGCHGDEEVAMGTLSNMAYYILIFCKLFVRTGEVTKMPIIFPYFHDVVTTDQVPMFFGE